MGMPGPTYAPASRDTELQRRFKRYRHDFKRIFNKNLANFWRGPHLGLDGTMFTDLIIKEGGTKPIYDFIKTKYGQQTLEMIQDLMGIKETHAS